MDSFYAIIQSVWTIVVMVIFVSIVIWAWSGSNKKAFEEAANLPFDEDDDYISKKPETLKKEKKHV